MAGPWEQYAAPPASTGPWTQYAAPTPQGNGEHGYAYASPEEKPQPAESPVTTFDEYGRPLTDGVPPSMTDEFAAAAKATSPNMSNVAPIFPAPAPGAVGRIIEAGREGGANTPDTSGWAPGGLELGRYIVNPVLETSGALFRGGQQFLQEAFSPISPQLGRDVAALPEAFPTGFGETGGLDLEPRSPPTAQAARDVLGRKITVQELTDAIKRSDINAGVPDNQMLLPGEPQPPAAPQTPPSPPAPAFVPPGSPAARVRPTEIPPPGARSIDEQGVAAPIQPPPNRFAPSGVAADGTWIPPGQEPPPVGTGAAAAQPGTQAAGAAQTQNAFEKSVLQTAEDRAGPQMVDQTQYVKNAQRTEAARIFSPDNSVTDRTLKDTDPQGYGAAALKVENDAKDTILDKYKELAGDNHAVDAAVKTREAFSPDQLGVFENQHPTTMGQNIVDYFNRLLDSPEGKRGNVAGILQDARDGFLDKNGNAETMPSVLYGGRKNVTDILNEGLGSSTSARKASVQAARKFLTDALENHIDPAINNGAPLFDTFRTQWSALSKPIDRMNFLQEHLFGPGDVRGTDGKIQFQAVQNLLEKMVKMRKAVGNNPAKSFDLPHLDELTAIRNELAAWHLRDRLFNAAGSPTVQRATKAAQLQSGKLGQAISLGVDAAAHTAAARYLGPSANIAYQTMGRPIMQRALQIPAARKLERTKARMLSTTPNSLMPP